MGCNSLVYVHLARLDCAELFKTSSVSFQGKSQYLQGSEVADLVGVTGAAKNCQFTAHLYASLRG